MVQLERLQYLVSTRVHVVDVLVGESRWLEGSWIIQGDALIGVDMKKAEIRDADRKARTAVIILPQPAVLSARVNHEKSQQWDIKSRSWLPLASLILGDRAAMEKEAMLEAQQLIERVAGSDDHQATARHGVEGMLVPAGDVEGLAAALERLGCDPALRAAMAHAARRRAEEFTWLRYHAALAEAVGDLVKEIA